MVLERLSGAAGRGAGGFLGGIFNNIGVVAIALGLGALFLFRGDIRGAFGSLGESLGDFGSVELPDIQLPTINFPEITFPTFEFPTIEFPTIAIPDVLGGAGEAIGGAGEQAAGFFEGLQDQFNQFIGGIFGGVQVPPQFEGAGTPEDPFIVPSGPAGGGIPIVDELIAIFTPAPEQDFGVTIDPSLVGQVGGGFVGGGPSFEGGTIFQTPIENLSLSQIIDMFNVTASQAADILAQAQGFTPEEQAFLDQGPVDVGGFIGGGPPAVSDPQFEGLTPEQIAAILTGGNISNF